MTKIIKHIRRLSKRSFCTLGASGALVLLTAGTLPAQTSDDTSASVRSGPGAFGTANPAGAAAEVNDDGEPSNAFEFVSPVRAVTGAAGAAANVGSPVVNPASNTLAGDTVHLPPENSALAFEVPRPATGLSSAAKAGVCALLACGLLVLGVVGLRALPAQGRTRERSLEAS